MALAPQPQVALLAAVFPPLVRAAVQVLHVAVQATAVEAVAQVAVTAVAVALPLQCQAAAVQPEVPPAAAEPPVAAEEDNVRNNVIWAIIGTGYQRMCDSLFYFIILPPLAELIQPIHNFFPIGLFSALLPY